MNLRKNETYLRLAVFLFLLTSRNAHAAGAAAWEKALQTAVDYMTGSTARLLAILAVAGFGIAAFLGRISWKRAIEIAVGIGIVFGAATIVDNLTGQ